MNETKFQVIVAIERIDDEGTCKTLRQVGETVLLGKFDALEDAQSFIATLPRKPE